MAVRLKPQGKQPKRSGFNTRQLVLLTALVMIQHLVLLTLSGVAQAALSYAPNGAVSAVAIDSDGTRYLGGAFTSMAPGTGGGAQLDASSASVNMSFPPVAGRINVTVTDGNGGWYIGGSFTSVGGITRNRLAQIDSSGNVTSWNPNVSGTVLALAVSGSTVYVGGAFTTIGGSTRNYLAAIGTDGTLTSWDPNINSQANALAISGSTVYIGGNFTTVCPSGSSCYNGSAIQSRNRLAAISTDGTTLANWDPNASGAVYAIALSGSSVYAGGSFTTMGGSARNRLAEIGTDGTLASWDPNASAVVNALAVSSEGTVYAGGAFTTMGGSTRNRLAAIGTDGTLASWDPNASGTVNALTVSGSTVYVGGLFNGSNSLNGNLTRNRLAAVDATTGTATRWDPNASSTVNALVVSGSTVYAGGNFATIGAGTTRNRLAAIASDGSLSSWNPNADSIVRALAVSGSTVYAGGDFITIGSSTRNRLALIGTDGTLASWNPNADAAVNALAVSSDGTVYAGGAFTSLCTAPSTCSSQIVSPATSVTRNRLAAINADGTLSTSWDPNASAVVNALAVSSEGTVYAGGAFTTVCASPSSCTSSFNSPATNVTRKRLAAIGTDGSLIAGFNPNASNTVSALAVSGSNVYAGGTFTTVCGSPSSCYNNTAAQTRNSVAAFGTNGSLVTSWNPKPSGIISNAVNALAIGGSTVYVGGAFTTMGGSTRKSLAAISTDGTTLASWSPNADAQINALALSGGTVVAGGAFTTMASNLQANSPTAYYSNLDVSSVTPNAPTSLSATAGNEQASISFTAGAAGGSDISNYQYSTDGSNYTALNPAQTASPVTLTGLTGGTAYSITLKAVNAAGAGIASAAVSVTPYGVCGPGISLTTGSNGVGSLWQMLALPCVPTSSTIAGAFGDGTSSNLTTTNYASPAPPYIGWLIEERTVGATPAYMPLLNSTDSLSVGTGYWIKSFQAPTNGKLSMDGTATPAAVTQAQGCYSANGCKAITLTTYSAQANRYNLVGNPFAYAIDWSKVRIRVDGSSTTYTPAQAAGAATGDLLNLTTPVISNTINIWNNTSYVAFTDVAPYTSTPNLQYFKSFWVNVLPGAFGHTVELLIPAEQSTLSFNQASPANLEQVATLEMPWYMGWLDWVVSPATAAVPVVKTPVKPQALPNFKDWTIRLKVNNPVTGWQDNGNLLGQLSDAQVGYDNHDVHKMTPFAAPFMTLVFPHPDWLTNPADYCGDFHSPSKKVDSWTFEIRANPVGSQVFLSWVGDPALLKRSRLIDAATGKVIKPSDKRWAKNGYPITLKKDVQRYIWKVLAK